MQLGSDPCPSMADTSLLVSDGSENRVPKYVLASVCSWFGSVALGTVIGYTANTIPSLKESGSHVKVDDNDISWLGSLMALGGVLGSIFAGISLNNHLIYVSINLCHILCFAPKGSSIEYIGRKGTLILTSIPFIFGWLLMAYSGNLESVTALLIGRFITGLCCGLVSLSAPVYITETANPSKRGFLGSGFQLSVTIGVLLTFITGKYVSWAYCALINSIFPIILMIGMCFMPETPYWLIKRGRISEATEANLFLHGLEGAQLMNLDISVSSVNSDGLQTEDKSIRLSEFKKKNVYKPILLSLSLMFFQQFSGVNALIFYTTSIFNSSGSSALDATDATIIVGAVQVLATFAACLLTDRAGRRLLLIISSLGCGLSILLLSIYHFIQDSKGDGFVQNFDWIPIVSLISFMITFSLGLGPLAWLLMGELLPAHVKSVASGLCSSFNWMCAFLVTKFFNNLKNELNDSGTYLFFAIICLYLCSFCRMFITRNKRKIVNRN